MSIFEHDWTTDSTLTLAECARCGRMAYFRPGANAFEVASRYPCKRHA